MDQHRSQTLLQYTFPLHLPLFPNTHNLLSLQILAFWVGEREGLKSFGPATSFYENRGLERKWLVQCTSFAHCSALCQPPPVYSSQREPRDVPAGASVQNEGCPPPCWPVWPWCRELGEAVSACLSLLHVWGGGGSWQPGPSWLRSTEVRPASWTDHPLQGRRADGAWRQMGPRPALVSEGATPTRVWGGPPIFQLGPAGRFFCFVLFSFSFFFLITSCVSSDNEEEYVTLSWEFPRVLFLSFITTDRFSACFLSSSPRRSEPA